MPKSSQNDAKINIQFMKKTSFQKTLKVLKPLYLLCRMHIAEGSPTQKAIKKERKINAKSCSTIACEKHEKKQENGPKKGAKSMKNPEK